MKLIERTSYLEELKKLRGTPDIKIITGMRRVGKSKMMEAYLAWVKEQDADANIIFVNFFDLAFEELKEYHQLYNYIESRYAAKKKNYLFIDEVQLCPKFELAVNSLYASEKYDIYLTGSNAFLLSADLATLFTGRYIELHVFPFSFKEFCLYFSDRNDLDSLFDEFTVKGGLSGSYLYEDEKLRTAYLREVYATILNRDLVQKFNLPDTTTLNRLSEFLMDNISNLTTANSISNMLNADKVSTNHVTVQKYISHLCQAFLFYKIKRYDIRGRKYLESNDKYYLNDTGLRLAVLGTHNLDFGRMYENIVCIELLRRGYEVYVGKLYQKEIDFVAKKADEKFYIQVSDDISNPETFKREYEPLLKIKDAYPKLIIARTKHPDILFEGIRVCDIARWLAE